MDNFETVKENILKRRSIKPEKFNGQSIPDSDIEELLELAHWAPTHGHTEPWEFKIFKGPHLAKLASYHSLLYKQETPEDKYKQLKFDKILDRVAKVSHVISIGLKRGDHPKIPIVEERASVAIAMQNIWLGATAKGIACYWGSGGMTYHPSFKEFFGLGEKDHLMGLFYLGYIDGEHPNGKRVSTFKDKYSFAEIT